MKILYVNPIPDNSIVALLARRGHQVIFVIGTAEALDAIAAHPYSAVLMAGGIEDSEAFEFISKVHKAQPELLVFQLSVWRDELVETLESLETIGTAGDATQS